MSETFSAVQQERDAAVRWIGIVGEELVNLGFPSGDRTVQLKNLRDLIREHRCKKATEKFYIALRIYNYDASPRTQRLKYTVRGGEQRAREVAGRLTALIGRGGVADNRTGRWLESRLSVYGFIDHVEGIYRETTEKIG